MASASRRLVPSVSTMWGVVHSRSTVMVARVLDMIVVKPEGFRLLLGGCDCDRGVSIGVSVRVRSGCYLSSLEWLDRR